MAEPARAPARGGVFRRKIGPLPMWGWLSIGVGGIAAWALWAHHKAGQQTQGMGAGGSAATPPVITQVLPPYPPPVPTSDGQGGTGDGGDTEDGGGGTGGHRKHRHLKKPRPRPVPFPPVDPHGPPVHVGPSPVGPPVHRRREPPVPFPPVGNGGPPVAQPGG